MNRQQIKSFLEYFKILSFLAFLVLLAVYGSRINRYLYLRELKSILSKGVETTGEIIEEGNRKGKYKLVLYSFKNKTYTFKTWHFDEGTQIGDIVIVAVDTTEVDNALVVLRDVKE